MTISIGNLAAAAELVLATFAAELESFDIEVPGVRYVQPGSGIAAVAWDGEQFTVSLQEIRQGQPGAAFAGTQYPGAAVLQAQWAIVLLRTIPGLSGDGPFGSQIPAASAADKAGQGNMADVAALCRAALAIHRAYTLTPPGTGFSLDSCRPLGPMGNVAGAALVFTVSLT